MDYQEGRNKTADLGQNETQKKEQEPKKMRIRTLEELNQDMSQYKGKILSYRADGKKVKPVKSVEEMQKIRKKAPVNYGRSTDEKVAYVPPEVDERLQEFEYPWEKADADKSRTQMQEEMSEETVPNFVLQGGIGEPEADSEETISYSVNGLNMEYLQSILDEEEEELKQKENEAEQEEKATDNPLKSEIQETEIKKEEIEQLKAKIAQLKLEIENAEAEKVEKKAVEQPEPKADNVTGNVPTEQPENRIQVAEQPEPKTDNVTGKVPTEQLGNRIQAAEQPEPKTDDVAAQAQVNADERQSETQIKKQEKQDASQPQQPDETSGEPEEEKDAVILEEKEGMTLYKFVKEMMTYAVCLAIALVLALVLVTFVGQKTEVIGDSMNPMLQSGEQLVIDKISYRFTAPKRFDIVVFPHENTTYTKRIIGLPGETISIEEGYIYIDGQLLADDVYGSEQITPDHYYRLAEPVKLGENEYFVLGDNRNNSTDSRDPEVGNLKKEQFKGKIVFRIWPLEQLGTLD